MTRPYKFRPDGPGSTKPPMMIQINGVMCEARNIAVAYALEGLRPGEIAERFRSRISVEQIRSWLYEARKLGLDVPRSSTSPRPARHYRQIGEYVDRTARRAQIQFDAQLRKALEA